MIKKVKVVELDFVNTSEAYSKPVYIGNNNVAIPYINIGLMPKNPINGRQSVLDYSYYVFTGVRSMSFNASKGNLAVEFDFHSVNGLITEYVGAGGYDTENGAEVKIEAESRLFYYPDTAKINEPGHPFMPQDTPNFRANMDKAVVDAFFSITNLPDEIREILGNDLYSLVWY